MLNAIKFGQGKAKAIILSPIQAEALNIEGIENTLNFLAQDYQMEYIDSLQWINQAKTIEAYISLFKQKIYHLLNEANLIIGFSFGGTLLQYILPELDNISAKLILISSPSLIDKSLHKKLSHIRELLLLGHSKEAVNYLNGFIFNQDNNPEEKELNQLGINRLLEGFRLILEADAKNHIKLSKKKYLHLCGDSSTLVNINHIITNKNALIASVPHAKMRVLQDNPNYSQKIIKNYLGI